MKDPAPLLAEDLWAEEPDLDFDDDYEPEELDVEDDWPIVEDVRRLLHDS